MRGRRQLPNHEVEVAGVELRVVIQTHCDCHLDRPEETLSSLTTASGMLARILEISKSLACDLDRTRGGSILLA